MLLEMPYPPGQGVRPQAAPAGTNQLPPFLSQPTHAWAGRGATGCSLHPSSSPCSNKLKSVFGSNSIAPLQVHREQCSPWLQTPLLTLQVFTFQMLKPSVAQSLPGGAANSSFLLCEKACSSEQSAVYHKTYEQGSAEKAPITNTPTDREG